MRCLACIILFFPYLLFAQVPFFEGDLEALKEKAQAEQRVYFVDMYTSWCGYCKKMDATTFQDKVLGEYVQTKFLAYKLNAEQTPGKELAAEYRVKGYPTVLVFNHKGELIDQIVGYKDAANFKLALEKHESKSHAKTVDASVMNEYITYQQEDMQQLENSLLRNPMDEFSSHKQHAVRLGEQNNRFEFEELQFELQQKYGAAKAEEFELYYQLGKKDDAQVLVEVAQLRKKGFLSDDQLAYFIRYFSIEQQPTIEQLRWVNELLLKDKSADLLELKVFVQFRYGDIEDAKSTLKELSKKSDKKHAHRTELLEDLVNQ